MKLDKGTSKVQGKSELAFASKDTACDVHI